MSDQHNVSPQDEPSIPEDSSWQQSFTLRSPRSAFWTDAAPENPDGESNIGNAEALHSFNSNSGVTASLPMSLSFKPASIQEAVTSDSFGTTDNEYPIRTLSANNSVIFGGITKDGDSESEPAGIQNHTNFDQNSESYKILTASSEPSMLYQTDSGNSDYHHGVSPTGFHNQRGSISDSSHQYPIRASSSDSSDIHFGNRIHHETQSSPIHQNAGDDFSFETPRSDWSKFEGSSSIDLGCEIAHPDGAFQTSRDDLPIPQPLHSSFSGTLDSDPLQSPLKNSSAQDIDLGI